MSLITRALARIVRGSETVKESLETLLQFECRVARAWASGAHRRLMRLQWGFPPEPEHFDHHIDLYYQWQATRNSLWVERGVFSALALQGGDVLELACGDGFNAKNFYSLRSNAIIAMDLDPAAIKTAVTKNAAHNVQYRLGDIRKDIPEGRFENVIWDAAIEHFTPAEIAGIMHTIKDRLTQDGILSGYTIVERSDGKSLSHHEYEFQSMEDLRRFLTPHFRNVTVFETVFPNRHNLYFWASDGCLPFGDGWRGAVAG